MDFTFSDTQRDIAELADRILAEKCPPEVLRKLENGQSPAERLATDAWAALADADLLGLAVGEADGGSGLGILEAALVAQQVGRRVALVPYWSSTAAALAIGWSGSGKARSRYLPGAISGAGPLAVALWEPGHGSPEHPAVTATAEGNGYRLDGIKSPVPWAGVAEAVLVTAWLEGSGDRAVFVVDSRAAGVTMRSETSITHEPTATLIFEGVEVGPEALLGTGDLADRLERHTQALLLATMLGVCEEALAVTGRYVSEREQFSTPIGTFQAVAHRCADAYIDTEAIRLTTLQAFWRLDHSDRTGVEDQSPTGSGDGTGQAIDIARFWACEGGHRVVHAAQHLHGGIGVDVDYPIHRYFRWAKVVELLLGGTNSSLSAIGTSMAAAGDDTADGCDDLDHATNAGREQP